MHSPCLKPSRCVGVEHLLHCFMPVSIGNPPVIACRNSPGGLLPLFLFLAMILPFLDAVPGWIEIADPGRTSPTIDQWNRVRIEVELRLKL